LREGGGGEKEGERHLFTQDFREGGGRTLHQTNVPFITKKSDEATEHSKDEAKIAKTNSPAEKGDKRAGNNTS